MAGIVDLIAKHGQGGQSYNMRRLQGAQADRTEQQTQIDRGQADDKAAMNDLKLSQGEADQQKRIALDGIAHEATDSNDWIERLGAGGFMAEQQQALKMKNGIRIQEQKLDEGQREKNAAEAAEMSKMIEGVEDQAGADAFFKQWDNKHPESDLDDMLPKEYNDETKTAFNIAKFAGKAVVDQWKMDKEKFIQQRHLDRMGNADRSADQRDQTISNSEKKVERKASEADRKFSMKLRKEYTSNVKDATTALAQIKLAKETLKQGKPLSDKMAQALLSKVGNSKIRALAEYNQYANFGDLQGRISGTFARMFSGTYSIKQREMGLKTLTDIEELFEASKSDSKNYYRYLAEKNKLDSNSIARYDSPDEIMESKFLSDEEKVKLAEKMFPDFDWGK